MAKNRKLARLAAGEIEILAGPSADRARLLSATVSLA